MTISVQTIKLQQGQILACFSDMAEQSTDALAEYLLHVGIENVGEDLPSSILEHYRAGDAYDVERAAQDLLTWPPVALRIRELQQQRAEEAATRERARKRASAGRKAQKISTPRSH